MSEHQYLRIRNWQKFQHYKDRNPDWIKLHLSLLSSEEWILAPSDKDRWCLVVIMLIAAKTNNRIPNNARYIQRMGGIDDEIDLGWLIDCGFLEPWAEDDMRENPWPSRHVPREMRDAVMKRDGEQCVFCAATENLEIDHIIPVSKGGASQIDNLQVLCRSCNRKKRTRVARATQSYAEGEGQRSAEGAPLISSLSKNIDTTPTVQKEASTREADADISYALDIFNEAAAEAGWPRAEKLTDKRRTGFRRTLAEYGIEGWRKGLAKARGSPFLRGDNDRGWRADLDFFLRPQTFTKLMEGSYEPSTSFQPLRNSGQSISESFASAVARRHGRGQRPADADDRFRTDEDGAEGHQEASRTIEGEVVAFPERH